MVHLGQRGRGSLLVAAHRNSIGVGGEPSQMERKILNTDFCPHGITGLLLDLREHVFMESWAAQEKKGANDEDCDTHQENRRHPTEFSFPRHSHAYRVLRKLVPE